MYYPNVLEGKQVPWFGGIYADIIVRKYKIYLLIRTHKKESSNWYIQKRRRIYI